MISRSTHAVMNNVAKPMESQALENFKVDLEEKIENQAPIRVFQRLEKKRISQDVALQLQLAKKPTETKKPKLTAVNKKQQVQEQPQKEQQQQEQQEESLETESKKRTARPQGDANSKLLQAVMALSDQSVNNLKLLQNKGVDMSFAQNTPKHLRHNGSILSGSSSRYHRRYKHRLHSRMFHNTIHAFSTQCYDNPLYTNTPRNQKMNPSWEANKPITNKALMPLDKGVRNLISVSSGFTAKEADPMYNWNHPPQPNDYEIDLASIIKNVPNKREVQDVRSRLLQKHSAWENHIKAMKNADAVKPRLMNSHLLTDDPNSILDKPYKSDLTLPMPTSASGQIEALNVIKKDKDVGNIKSTNWPTIKKPKELLRLTKWEMGSRYLHSYGHNSHQ